MTDWSLRGVNGPMKVATGKSFTTSVPIAGRAADAAAAGHGRQGAADQVPGPGRAPTPKAIKIPTGKASSSASWPRCPRSRAGGRQDHPGRVSEGAEAALRGVVHGHARQGRPGLQVQPQPGGLVGYPPSYGSDTWFNDHHFHYGYFIRAAAGGGPVRPGVGEEVGRPWST